MHGRPASRCDAVFVERIALGYQTHRQPSSLVSLKSGADEAESIKPYLCKKGSLYWRRILVTVPFKGSFH